MEILDKQQVFDATVVALAEQGIQARDHDGSCAYRGQNGCKCALGHHIPDDKYYPSLEGQTADYVIATLGLPLDATLLKGLQRAHDMAYVESNDNPTFTKIWEGPTRPTKRNKGADCLGGIAYNLYTLGNVLGLNVHSVEEYFGSRP